jgi:Holliday junction resolvase-like predicted endonuclease
MNTVRKGYSKEKLCRDQLTREGWNIVFKSVRWKFGTIDYAQLFDVVVVKAKKKRHISVKHYGNSNQYLTHQNNIKHYANKHGLPHETFELWLWDKPRWKGRGKNKVWSEGGWIRKVFETTTITENFK